MPAPALPERILNVQVPWANLRPDEFTHVPCPLCGAGDYRVKAALVINWSEFFIVQCPRCRVMWRNPMPDAGFLMDLYDEDYFDVRPYPPGVLLQVGIADTLDADQRRRREITQREVQDWITVRKILPRDAQGNPRKLLEIGGGRGYLQRAAGEAGWSTLGLEISPHGIKEAIHRGMMVLPVVLDELCDKYVPYTRFFDLIVFFDFLEHVTDPGRVLRMVRFLLKDDGRVILRVPCIGDDECPKYHLIDHIWHFSTGTLELFLNREGFEVCESRESGRFPGADGQIRNYTFIAQKRPGSPAK
jgi:SAM-dependent methyltransferase